MQGFVPCIFLRVIKIPARKANKVVILGGGFIGAGFAREQAQNSNCEIHIVEMMPKKVLSLALDDEFCDDVAEQLLGVNVRGVCHVGGRGQPVEGPLNWKAASRVPCLRPLSSR